MCEDTSIKGPYVDTTLGSPGGGSGVDGVSLIFPGTSPNGGLVEQPLWDSIAAEPARLSGVSVRIYSVRRAKNRHPLYAEPSVGGDWEFHGPWELMGSFEFDQSRDLSDEVSQEGLQKTTTAQLTLARRDMETIEAPDPKIGDVIWLWDRAPFSSEFQYWDVTLAAPDGNIFTNESFVQWRLELRRRSRFEPGRKLP